MSLAQLFDSPRLRPLFRLGLLVCMLALAYLAFGPSYTLPGVDSDKANHFIAFFTLSALAQGAFPGARLTSHRVALVLGYGVLIELVQHFLPAREASLLDLAADAAAVLAWSLTFALLERAGGRARAR